MNEKANQRKNRTLAELIVAMLFNFGTASHWWDDILMTMCYDLNWVPKSNFFLSPYEILKNKTPNVYYLRV